MPTAPLSLKKNIFFFLELSKETLQIFFKVAYDFFFLEQKEIEIGQYLSTQKNNFTDIIMVRNLSVLESESLDLNCISISY